MKTFALAVWVLFYCVWFIYYMDNFIHPRFDYETFKALTGIVWGLGIILPWLDEVTGYKDHLNRYVNYVAKLISATTFFVFSLHYLHVFNDTYCELYTGLVFIAAETILLMSRAYRKGYFKRNIA